MLVSRAGVIALVVWACATPATAQAPDRGTRPGARCAGPADSPFRALDPRRLLAVAGGGDTGSEVIVRPSDRGDARACAPGRRAAANGAATGFAAAPVVRALPIDWRAAAATRYPTDRNNGALWATRGVAAVIGGGVLLRWGPVSAALAPRAVFVRVRKGGGRYEQPLDWRAPLAREPAWTLHAGQSYVRADAFGVKLGLSTENLWWGPAHRYPLLMSNTAPGFPHVFLGTAREIDIGIGRLDAEMVWGHLQESTDFDDDAGNDRHMFAGLAAAFRPAGVDALSLGVAHAYLAGIPPDGLTLSDYLLRPFEYATTNPLEGPLVDNKLLSLFARWAFPDVGFEAYAEWARDDFWHTSRDLILELDHSQAYLVGLRKRLRVRGRPVRIIGEAASLGTGKSTLTGRGTIRFYTHGRLRQGYTNRGQLVGAWIGPGADAQFLAVDVSTGGGPIGFYVERVRRNGDHYYREWAVRYGVAGADVELGTGVRGVRRFGTMDVSWDIAYARRWNRGFNGLANRRRVESEDNLRLEIGATWWPDGRPGATGPASDPVTR